MIHCSVRDLPLCVCGSHSMVVFLPLLLGLTCFLENLCYNATSFYSGLPDNCKTHKARFRSISKPFWHSLAWKFINSLVQVSAVSQCCSLLQHFSTLQYERKIFVKYLLGIASFQTGKTLPLQLSWVGFDLKLMTLSAANLCNFQGVFNYQRDRHMTSS